jgi:transcriptional regulator with XRE-family HTH domain
MTPDQCRRARELLGWSEREFVQRVGRSLQTIRYFEAGRGTPQPATVQALRNALEAAGVEFIDGGASGVRLRPRTA